jgi:REP element-mobilizing transposase RayT
MAKRTKQLGLPLKPKPTWGGVREGAGRKPSANPQLPHRSRADIDPHHPLHATLRVVRGLPNLRRKSAARIIRVAIMLGCERFGFRLVHYSIQSNHLHLIVEADDKKALARGLKGFQIRIARGLNRILGRKGRVFVDRYHARALETPREVRNCLAYVLLNQRRHAPRAHYAKGWIDPLSSGAAYEVWRRDLKLVPPEQEWTPVALPATWLLNKGWRRHGLLSPDERRSVGGFGAELDVPM